MVNTGYTIKELIILQNKFFNMWIEVFELTALQEEEESYELTNCNVMSRFFFTIDSFGKYKDYDGLEYVSFYSSGIEWISILKLDEFTELYINKKK